MKTEIPPEVVFPADPFSVVGARAAFFEFLKVHDGQLLEDGTIERETFEKLRAMATLEVMIAMNYPSGMHKPESILPLWIVPLRFESGVSIHEQVASELNIDINELYKRKFQEEAIARPQFKVSRFWLMAHSWFTAAFLYVLAHYLLSDRWGFAILGLIFWVIISKQFEKWVIKEVPGGGE